jgi:hypothetical protein
MSFAKCPNCTRTILDGYKHIPMPNGWCEVIARPKFVKSVAKKPKT